MSYNNLWDFAKNQNLYDDDDDDDDNDDNYVIYVKKPKKKYTRTEQDDKNNNLLCMIFFHYIYSSFSILSICTKKISTIKGGVIYELWSI